MTTAAGALSAGFGLRLAGRDMRIATRWRGFCGAAVCRGGRREDRAPGGAGTRTRGFEWRA
jgi:hypothetical protein